MKKKISWIFLAFAMMFLMVSVSARAAQADSSGNDASDIIGQVKQQLSSAFENVDQETAGQVFSFIKEKINEGNLYTDEGISSAIEEGKNKFGFEMDKGDAKKLVETMEKLEGMGFSAEYVVDKTESLYNEYGASFVDHVDEVVAGAVKNAASNAASSFFDNLKQSIKDFFNNLFS